MVDTRAKVPYQNACSMKSVPTLHIPVGVSLTHDKGHPVIFAYVGAKRFNPGVLGGMERALKAAVRWRRLALKEHTTALAALPPRQKRRTVKTPRKGTKTRTARR